MTLKDLLDDALSAARDRAAEELAAREARLSGYRGPRKPPALSTLARLARRDNANRRRA